MSGRMRPPREPLSDPPPRLMRAASAYILLVAMATQKEVADLAGVSFITVSRVINGMDNVAPETRGRVEAAIKELNYHPNRQAQALNNGLTRSLAFVTPRMYELPLYNNFFVMSLLSGVELQARELGWDLLLTTDYDRGGEFDFLRVWHQRKVDGLVFVGFQRFPPSQLRTIEERGIPCVSIADRLESPAISWVDADNRTAARDAVRRLYDKGHRSFAFVGVDPELDYNPNILERESDAREALAELGLGMTLVRSDSAAPGSGRIAARRYLELPDPPTAVISGNDSIAFRFMAECAERGRLCPRDFSLVGFDAEPSGRLSSPTLASYEQPLLEMGKRAVRALVDRIVVEDWSKEELVFPLDFVDGSSLGASPA
jgi:LacI family transcriptional regulator